MKLSSSIHYVDGDATRPIGTGPRVLAHICNDEGKWGKGFVLAISKRWKEPELVYKQTFRSGNIAPLGDVQFVEVEPDITVANMIGQHGIRKGTRGEPPIRYEAVQQALDKVAGYAAEHGASVHMPRIGSGLAGGSWQEIERLINSTLIEKGVEVIVYNYQA